MHRVRRKKVETCENQSEDVVWFRMSPDATTIVYATEEKLRVVIYSDGFVSTAQELTLDDGCYTLPVFSKLGNHLHVSKVASNVNDHIEDTYVWLHIDWRRQTDPAVLKGTWATWGLGGEYLHVVETSKNQSSCISVYQTQNLKPGRGNRSWRQLAINTAVPDVEAKIFNHQHGPRMAICDQGDNGNRRFLIWDMTEDVIVKEVLASVSITPAQVNVRRPPYAHLPLLIMEGGGIIKVTDDRKGATCYFVNEEHPFPKNSISSDGLWIAALSSNDLSCSIISTISGAPICTIQLPEDDFIVGDVLNQVRFDQMDGHLMIGGRKSIHAYVLPDSHCLEPQMTSSSDLSLMRCNALESDQISESFLKGHCEEEIMHQLIHPPSAPGFEMALSKATSHLYAFLDRRVERNPVPISGAKWDNINIPGIHFLPLSQLPSGINIKRITRAFVYYDSDADSFSIAFIKQGDVAVSSSRILKFHLFVANPNIQTESTVYYLCSLSNDSKGHVFLSLSLTRDSRRLVVLGTDSVFIVNISNGSIEHRIDYLSDLSHLVRCAQQSCKWSRWRKWSGSVYSGRSLSDNGRKVLLGWDTKNAVSIIVEPGSSRTWCERSIEESENCLSDFCCLSWDASITTFIDMNELQNGNLVVGIYREESQLVVARFHVLTGLQIQSLRHWDVCKLCRCLYFDVRTDRMELVVFFAATHEAFKHRRSDDPIVVFQPTARTGMCPDYDRLINTVTPTTTKAVDWVLGHVGSVAAFNVPHGKGTSIFQEAFMRNDREMVNMVMKLCQDHDVPLALEWMDHQGMHHSILSDSIHRRSTSDVRSAMALVKHAPFVQSARMIKEHFGQMLTEYPQIIEEALSKDQLVFEVCQLKVHPDYLDSTIRQNTAIHISTVNTILEWKLDKDSEKAGERWKSALYEEVMTLENKANKPRELASLHAVCIEDAAGIGMKGIIRPLLMSEAPPGIFNSAAVKWTVLWKWTVIWKPRFLKMAIRYGVFLMTFTIYSITIGRRHDLASQDWPFYVVSGILLSACFVFGCDMLAEEIRQLMSYTRDGWQHLRDPWWGMKFFFSSRWNWVDVASSFLLLVPIPVFHALACAGFGMKDWLLATVAIEGIIASIKIWYFAQPFKNSGALVLMIDSVIKECRVFLLLSFSVLFGFSIALHVLFGSVIGNGDSEETITHNAVRGFTSGEDNENESDVQQAFGTFHGSLLSMFLAMVGMLDAALFYSKSRLSWLIKGTFVAYMIAQMIVLLNLLIAIMSDTFDKVKSSEMAQMLMARAKFLDASEAGLTKKQRKEMEKQIGKYVVVLNNEKEVPEMDGLPEWLGRVNTLQHSFRRDIKESEQRLHSLIETNERNTVERVQSMVIDHMPGVESTVEASERRVMNEMRRIERTMSEKVEKLEGMLTEMHAQLTSELRQRLHDRDEQHGT